MYEEIITIPSLLGTQNSFDVITWEIIYESLVTNLCKLDEVPVSTVTNLQGNKFIFPHHMFITFDSKKDCSFF
jgi:hypothetical protein